MLQEAGSERYAEFSHSAGVWPAGIIRGSWGTGNFASWFVKLSTGYCSSHGGAVSMNRNACAAVVGQTPDKANRCLAKYGRNRVQTPPTTYRTYSSNDQAAGGSHEVAWHIKKVAVAVLSQRCFSVLTNPFSICITYQCITEALGMNSGIAVAAHFLEGKLGGWCIANSAV